MATAQRASGTPTLRQSARAGRTRGWRPWQSPLTQMVEGSILTGFGVAGITRTLEVHDPVFWPRQTGDLSEALDRPGDERHHARGTQEVEPNAEQRDHRTPQPMISPGK